jgi:alcohol dehydrogenase class IV
LENEKIRFNSQRYETDIKALKNKLEELQQKIELNTILKDIDVGELKILSQNNAMVNNSINSLLSKWDKVQMKMQEMEARSSEKA